MIPLNGSGRSSMQHKKKFTLIAMLMVIVIFTGVMGYMFLLNVHFVDALYMTAITISTVGYGEVAKMNDAAKLFSILLIFSGLGVVGYGVTSLFTLVFEGEMREAWRKKRMETKIRELKDHYIVCGAGAVGQTVIKSFREHAAPFVVIEENEKRVEDLQASGVLAITGDATNEDILQQAGILRARGIVCTLSTDAENVFTVLTARQMHDDIYIVSKAIDPSAHRKLLKAGANKTISPNEIGGLRIAAHMVRPSVISFLDMITRSGEIALELEEVVIKAHSALAGKKLSEAKIPEQSGLIVLALRKKEDKDFKFNPSSKETLEEGDTMVVLGTDEQVMRLSAL